MIRFREALTKLAFSSGIVTGSENIQIISGAQQGIDLVAKGLIYPGETVLIERPSYSGAMQAFISRSARLI
jgi:2-aminoadipate transaminase